MFTVAGATSADPAVRSASTSPGFTVNGSGPTFFVVELFARARWANSS